MSVKGHRVTATLPPRTATNGIGQCRSRRSRPAATPGTRRPPCSDTNGPTTRAGPASSAATPPQDVVEPARQRHGGAHAGPPRCRAAVGGVAAASTFTRALGALTGNQAVQMVKAGWRRSTCPAGRSRPTRTWPARPTPTSACTRPTRCRPSSAGSTTPCCAPTRSAHALATPVRPESRSTDYLVPIVADAEAGFGGPLNAFELMKSMIAAGAAGVHWEDQLASEKKCGHLGGKVLVPTAQHVRTLNAARLAADICGVPTLVIARTDALAADLLTSDVDPIDAAVPHRRAHRGGLLPSAQRHRAGAGPGQGLRAVRRPDLGRDRHPGPRPGPRVRHRAAPRIPRKDVGLQLLSVVQLEGRARPTTRSRRSRTSSATWDTSSSSSPWPASTRSTTRCSTWPRVRPDRDDGLRRAAGGRVRRRVRRLHRGQAPGRGRHRLLRQGRHRAQPATAAPSRWPAPPKKSSSTDSPNSPEPTSAGGLTCTSTRRRAPDCPAFPPAEARSRARCSPLRGDPDARGAGLRGQARRRASPAAGPSCWPPAASAASGSRAGETVGLPPRHRRASGPTRPGGSRPRRRA